MLKYHSFRLSPFIYFTFPQTYPSIRSSQLYEINWIWKYFKWHIKLFDYIYNEDIRPNFLVRIEKHWCSLPREAVKSPTQEDFKNRLHKHVSERHCLSWYFSGAKEWTRRPIESLIILLSRSLGFYIIDLQLLKSYHWNFMSLSWKIGNQIKIEIIKLEVSVLINVYLTQFCQNTKCQ